MGHPRCLLVLLLVTAIAHGQQDVASFAGRYPLKLSFCGTCGNEYLELRADGAAAQVDVSDYGTSRLEGRATVEGGVLTLFWDEAGRSDRWQKVPPEESFLAVEWGERRYLVRPTEVSAFCEQIRFGVEPRSDTDGTPYLRVGDERRTARGLPELPVEARASLARPSFEARITRVDEDEAEIELLSGEAVAAGTLLHVFPAPEGDARVEAVPVRTLPMHDGKLRVRWAGIDDPTWRAGECVSSRFMFNRWSYPLELRRAGGSGNPADEGRGPFVLRIAFLLPLSGSDDRYEAAFEAARSLVGTDSPIDSRARVKPDGVPISELTPALINAALLIPVDRRSSLVQVAMLANYWDERQQGVHPLGLDVDLDRFTPQAQGERLQALHDWAEWWRATASDPAALAEWTAAVQRAGGH